MRDSSLGQMTTCYSQEGEHRRVYRVSDVEGKELHNLKLAEDRFRVEACKEQGNINPGKLGNVRQHRRSNVTPPLSSYQRFILFNNVR